jgi:ribosomal-protein-alanine N-acetyltransferase
MIIRIATEEDLPQILTIDRESLTPTWSRETFLNEINSEDTRFILAIMGYATVGYCILKRVGDDAEILRTAVSKSQRRSGVANRLIMSMLRYSAANSIQSIYLEVRKSSEAAIALYKKHGFKPMGMRKDYYTQPVEDAMTMVYKNTGVSLYVDAGN